ncbi:hypothetical protein TSUD_82360 [Trifolium subterraneum]|uniref:Uncharacterized protein n=1 Tax=Trifolium subterraneum TaxID=3900 RepID=A0A2Z6PGJ6_TRISU|nr:hypothetical protein TSUD_82360 [Trifolium subterraneum]
MSVSGVRHRNMSLHPNMCIVHVSFTCSIFVSASYERFYFLYLNAVHGYSKLLNSARPRKPSLNRTRAITTLDQSFGQLNLFVGVFPSMRAKPTKERN